MHSFGHEGGKLGKGRGTTVHYSRPSNLLDRIIRLYRKRRQGESSVQYEFATSSRDDELSRLCLIAQITRALPDYRTYVKAQIGPVSAQLMLDTGNSFYSVISRQMQHALRISDSDLKPLEDHEKVGTAKKSASMEVAGITKKSHKIYLAEDLPPIETQLVVLPELGMPCNISGKDMKDNGITILPGDHIIYHGRRIPLVSRKGQASDITKKDATVLPLYTAEKVTIEPLEEVYIQAVATSNWAGNSSEVASIIPSESIFEDFEVTPWRNAGITLYRKKTKQGAKYLTKVALLNANIFPVTIPKGTYYGDAEIMVNFNDPHREHYSVNFISNEPEGTVSCRELGPKDGICQISKPTDSDGIPVTKSGDLADAKKGKEYVIPPSPDKQSDPLAGDDVQLPAWMVGETNKENYTQRYQYLFELFKVGKNDMLSSGDERQRFITLLLSHWTLFAWDGTYGVTNLIEHYIRTPPDCKPINDRYRAPNPALTGSLKEQLAKWIKHDCIEPSDSAWNSNLLAVVKSSDISSVRWVIDYRKLNLATSIDRFPIGDVTDNLSRLGKSRYFSCLDNSGAFHCIPIAKEDRHKTSFATPFNTWQFKRLPFGLSGGPSSYSRLVVQVLRNIPPERAVAYVDDVLIHSSTFMQHLKNLNEVFEAYKKAGLRLNPKKCKFLQSRIDYLGHTVSAQGIEPQAGYLEVIKEWPVPTSLKDIEVFMGKAGYYRKFIHRFAQISKPLTDRLRIADVNPKKDAKGHKVKMTKAERRRLLDVPIELNAEELEAFKTLVNCLCTSPILGHPRFDDLTKEYFILDTDWSQDANTVSGVLSQNQLQPDGTYEEKVIGYASKKLSKSQANYSSPKGEISAILLMIEHFRYYLMVGHFILRTDNVAARALKDQSCPTGYWSRWKARLANFSFTPTHRSGTKHGNADSLSRISHTTNDPDENPDVFDEKTDRQYLFAIDSNSESGYSSIDEDWTAAVELDPWTEEEISSIEQQLESVSDRVGKSQPWPYESYEDQDEHDHGLEIDAIEEDKLGVPVHDNHWTPNQIRDMQEEDRDLGLIRKWVRSGMKPETQARAEASSDLKTYINLFESLYLDRNDILRYNYQFDQYDGGGVKERHLIVLPDEALRSALRLVHETQAHIGSVKLTELALRYFYGTRVRSAAEYVCSTCLVCQAKGQKPKPQKYSLVSPRQGYPFQTLNLDFVGPLPTSSKGNVYLLTAECMLTRWVEAYPVKHADAATVANKLIVELFPRFGHCEFLKTDQGTHFKNETLKEICEITGIEHKFSPSYRPQSNPVERAHRTLKNMITAMVLKLGGAKNGKWEDYLPAALTAYRMSHHDSIGTSPFQALFGFPPSMELGMMFGPPPEHRDYPDKVSFAIAHRNRMSEVFAWINKNIATSIERRRRFYYNNPKRLFEIGDKVWLLTPRIPPGERKAFRSPFTGPWTITRRVNEAVYEIAPDPKWSRQRSEVVTVDRLKKYVSPDEDEDDVTATHPPAMKEDLSCKGNEFVEKLTTAAASSAETHELEDPDDDDDGWTSFADEGFGSGVPFGSGEESDAGSNAETTRDTEVREEPVNLFPPPVEPTPAQQEENRPLQIVPDPVQPVPLDVGGQDQNLPVDANHEPALDERQDGEAVEPDILFPPVQDQPREEPANRHDGDAVDQPPQPGPKRRGRPPGRTARHDWPSERVKRQAPGPAPTRLLPPRPNAHKAFSGAKVYDPERRQQAEDDNLNNLDSMSNTLNRPDSPIPAEVSMEWDNYDLNPARPSSLPTAASTPQTRAPDLADQSIVLQNRRQIAQRNDTRSNHRSRRLSRPPAANLMAIRENPRPSSQPAPRLSTAAPRPRPAISQPPPYIRRGMTAPTRPQMMSANTAPNENQTMTLLELARQHQNDADTDREYKALHDELRSILSIDLSQPHSAYQPRALNERWLSVLQEAPAPLSRRQAPESVRPPSPRRRRTIPQAKPTRAQLLRQKHIAKQSAKK